MSEVLTMEELAELEPAELTRERLTELKLRTAGDAPARRVVAAFVGDLAASASKLRSSDKMREARFVLGALQWVLSRFESAAESFREVKRDDVARDLEADCRLELGDYAGGLKLFAKLAEKNPCARFDLGRAACLRGLRRDERADKLLESFGDTYAGEAEFHYQMGLSHDRRGDCNSAVEAYQTAVELDGDHVKSLFRLAYIADLHGDDEEALKLYERCTAIRLPHVNALLNLGLLYEDMGRYEDAVKCCERVLAWNANHERAKLFLRDARASITMYYDEDLERKVDRENKVLEIPVTDFELSVRSRNCLERMNVKTLGDLTRVTEPELLSYKNFGETSLNEIKNTLASKGLRLGQALEQDTVHPAVEAEEPSEGVGLAGKSLNELELSVRARKCVQRLGIASIGQLCDRTEEALLACKNFGQTSLNEIRLKLANLGLKLREDK